MVPERPLVNRTADRRGVSRPDTSSSNAACSAQSALQLYRPLESRRIPSSLPCGRSSAFVATCSRGNPRTRRWAAAAETSARPLKPRPDPARDVLLVQKPFDHIHQVRVDDDRGVRVHTSMSTSWSGWRVSDSSMPKGSSSRASWAKARRHARCRFAAWRAFEPSSRRPRAPRASGSAR